MKDKSKQIPGEIALDSQSFKLMRAWEKLLVDRLGEKLPFMYAPLLIAKDELERTGYIAHFPQNALKVLSETKEDNASDRYLTPASCLHIYPEYKDKKLTEPIHHTVLGRCARHEAGAYQSPYRLSSFHMLEFVSIDTVSNINHINAEAGTRVSEIFSELGISASLVAANDPFFAGEDDGAYLLQKIKGLKRELVIHVAGTEVSLASINNHEQHFTEVYNIKIQNEVAASLCIAFGLERIVLYCLSLWGPEESAWPKSLQRYV
jgi:seryl-tRNA synthetase